MEEKYAGGRKPMLTPTLTKLICDVIRDGAYDHVAAGSAGISYRTHLRWLELGRADDASEPYASYCREISAARNQVRTAVEAEIRKILRQALDGEPDPDFDRLAADLRKLTAGRQQAPAEALQREDRDER